MYVKTNIISFFLLMDPHDYLRRIVDLNDANPSLKLSTKPLICSKYNCAKTLSIYPEEYDWNCRLLSVFINQLKDFKLDPKNGCRTRINGKDEVYHFFRFVSIDNPSKEFVLIDIKDKIQVRVSKKIADRWDDEIIKVNCHLIVAQLLC